jgi:hypothetical protein
MRITTAILLSSSVVSASSAARAADVTVVTDATWKVTNPAPPTGWNADVNFDDSTWVNAFKNPSGDNIWMTSNMSGQSPNQVWFRHVFTLTSAVASAVGDFYFDDNGQDYLNGHLLIDDTGGGATHFNGVTIDPSWFVVGQNLFAIHGVDTIAPFAAVAANVQITPVPEPPGLLLAVLAAAPLFLRNRSKRRR